jgi:Uma2 family endonuclease
MGMGRSPRTWWSRSSRRTNPSKLQKKLDDFLAAGVPLIWVVYPESQTVFVQRQNGSGHRLKVGDVLDGEDVLPGFRLEVAALFE